MTRQARPRSHRDRRRGRRKRKGKRKGKRRTTHRRPIFAAIVAPHVTLTLRGAPELQGAVDVAEAVGVEESASELRGLVGVASFHALLAVLLHAFHHGTQHDFGNLPWGRILNPNGAP